MLSLFPDLLFLAPLATTLIRVAAGIAYLYVGYRVFATARAQTASQLPLIGRPPYWLVIAGACAYALIGALLFVGMWTQGVAILAAIGALKIAILRKWYPGLMPLPSSSALLLFAISLSLIFSGAGAFAIDWPL